MNKGKLYLIPTPLGDNEPAEVLPAGVIERACSLRVFVVEEIRTARRFLSKYGLRGHIAELEFHELNEHSSAADVEALGALFDRGEDVGLLSEAGLPAVADPGAELVALCHRRGVEVVPLVGPSSLMLALMASGLNGQSFAFCGYVPAKPEERRNALKAMEKQSAAARRSQIIIETPYRNDALLADMLQTLSPRTRLCVAADITLPSQFIRTDSIAGWRSHVPEIGKRPCVFIILA
ncbi:MAG TPA: SAM-dependent methyltransferase [Candidatus Cryptobacteroides merdipullorum]|uniref:SAM-dependent methyltransferase n=1 Tax=Candidatus Cryptobacteroides merdipullorum TaxID=2840771 RepID=A0A9D1KHM5_9BACT|nr:SAM-dependent methyltransferase [Candidatus Cryptobacteroides merdipullorum]